MTAVQDTEVWHKFEVFYPVIPHPLKCLGKVKIFPKYFFHTVFTQKKWHKFYQNVASKFWFGSEKIGDNKHHNTQAY